MSCCSQVKEGRETWVEENERSLSGRVLSCCVWSHYPAFIKGMASPRHMFRLGEPALTLKNLFAFCFVNRLLLLSWKAGDAICSPSPKAVVITEGGIVSKTPGFCGYEGLGLGELFRPFAFGILAVSRLICASWWAKLLLFHVLCDVDTETFYHVVCRGTLTTPWGEKTPFSSINVTQQQLKAEWKRLHLFPWSTFSALFPGCVQLS